MCSQFGNMLVLAAAYNHGKLKHYVPEEKLRSLLDRTIAFLNYHAPISQTCKIDSRILERIRQRLFPFQEISIAVDNGHVPT